jgi:radical SAM protein with 4Fe4S-binding SPASM domain
MSCPTLSYGDFARRLAERVRGKRVPMMGSFELTFRCNLRCKHCYLDGQHDGVPGMEELSLDEIRDILDQVADAGCLWLLLTGGEPLVRDDFLDIYTYAKHKGFLIFLFTNGTLLTPEIADVLAEYPPFVTEVTLYGQTRETYERITGISGSFDRCIRGIELLVGRGLQTKLKTMLMTLNQHELSDIKGYAEDLGIGFRYDAKLNPGLDAERFPLDYRLSPEQIVAYDLRDADRMVEWHRFCERMMDSVSPRIHLYNCGAGVTAFHIDPFGKLSVCMLSREPEYDLREGSFDEGWKHVLRDTRYQAAPEDYICNQCELLSLCGQCPGWTKLEGGDPVKPVTFLCKLAHLRAKTLGLVEKSDNRIRGGAHE